MAHSDIQIRQRQRTMNGCTCLVLLVALSNTRTGRSQCANGFVDRLQEKARFTGGLGDSYRQKEQRIIPAINFTCEGYVTKWIVAGKWNSNNDNFPELQVWRRTGAEGMYIKVQGTTINGNVESGNEVYEYDISGSNPLVTFQEGDVLGIFLPRDSRLRPYFSERHGPPNYYTDTDDDETPTATTFQINDGDIQYATPLVTVEVSVPNGSARDCIGNFVSRDDIEFALQVDIDTRDGQQRIIPEMNFTCNGFITKWIVAGKWRKRESFPDLQIWRETNTSGAYVMVGITTLVVEDENRNTAIYEYSPDPPLEFQAGDVFGIYLPRRQLSRLWVYFDESGGPLNYYIYAASPVNVFTLSEANDARELPLIAVEISTTAIIPSITHGSSTEIQPQFSSTTIFLPPTIIPTTTPASPVPDQTSSPSVVTDEQESLPLTAIGGAVGAAAVAIAAIVVLTALVCAARKKSRNWTTTTPHMANVDNEMKENKAYGQHSEVIFTSENEAYGTTTTLSTSQNEACGTTTTTLSTSQNEAYGTTTTLSTSQNEAYGTTTTLSTSQNEAYGSTNVDHEDYDYARV